jgi:maltooligosyltrehalose trehalohydrolase
MLAGALYHGDGRCEFIVWAPLRKSVELKIIAPAERMIPLERSKKGYWRIEVRDVLQGAHYLYRLDNEKERPDPASRFQSEGVHGPSQVVDQSSFAWEDNGWKGIALQDYIIYELHVGTFTQEGTFDAIIPHLDYLKDLGITAIELMPVAQFPGSRNWGYDGVYPYAVQNSYGGPEGLKRLVNACRRKGIAVVLDVVYNHLGPEGNYLWDYGPYFTGKYKTSWGDAINFDGSYSDEVRNFFIQNALAWVTDYHIDALRIDAIHGIFDFSARHFLRELGEAVHRKAEELGRRIYVIPESDLNDVRVINPVELGGYGLDAQWNDDFHHCLHTVLTGEKSGYYEDFGAIDQMEKAYRDGFVYSGQYSTFRKRRHGSSSKDRPAHQFVVFSQNHDQVGNRMLGGRLSSLATFEQLKLAAGVVLLSPFIPLLFMGEEYGETAAFQYFVSHGDEELIEAVRKGRKEEFRDFGWEGEVPDPLADATFLKSKIDLELRQQGQHRTMLGFYKELIRLRKETASLNNLSKIDMEVKTFAAEKMLFVRRWQGCEEVFSLFNFSEDQHAVPLTLPEGIWEKMLDSSEIRWAGTGSSMEPSIDARGREVVVRMKPHSFILYRSVREAQ